MCNRARRDGEPETLFDKFRAEWATPRPMDNRFNPNELAPRSRADVVRQNDRGSGIDIMSWDVLGGMAKWPMTNVRQLGLPQWRRLAERPENRCLIPLTEFCEWTPEPIDLGDGKKPIKGEMWFQVIDQPLFAVAGFWQPVRDGLGFTMVTILAPEDHDRWLTGSYDDVVALQQPYPADRMTVRGPEFPTRNV